MCVHSDGKKAERVPNMQIEPNIEPIKGFFQGYLVPATLAPNVKIAIKHKPRIEMNNK